jgi:hypothetical protein
MKAGFNPYHRWLGISEAICRPNHYQLLDLRLGEDSAELIRYAADQRSRCLQPFLSGEHGLLARQILGEIAAARACLLDRQAKTLYDREIASGGLMSGGEPKLPAFAALSVPVVPKPSIPATEAGSIPPPGDLVSSTEASRVASSTSLAGGRRGAAVHRLAPRMAASRSTVTSLPEDGEDTVCVPMIGKASLDAVLRELAQAMGECRALYLSSVPHFEGMLTEVSQKLAERQEGLCRGLLAKIYATIAEADRRWILETQRCVATLLQHLGVAFAASDLQEAQPLKITAMKPVGSYAYAIHFSDGHDTGIYTLEHLRELGRDVAA